MNEISAGQHEVNHANSKGGKRGYRWIAREIESLNPEVDYARIWSLTTTYVVDEMFFNLLYALGLPCITQNPAGSELLARRTKKAAAKMHERAHDTLANFWVWYELGPEHIEAQRSVEQVNRIHEALAKGSPEAFADDDYIYTTCLLGTQGHEFREELGLKGFTENQKIAAHHFWRGIAMKMRGPKGYLEGYPKDFSSMQAFVREFEARPWPSCDSGHELAEYTIQQFCEAWYPVAFQWWGRQLILTFQKPHIRRLHRLGDPNPLVSWVYKRLVFAKIWLAENVFPDPKLSVPERARAQGRVDGQHQTPLMVPASEVPFQADGKTMPAMGAHSGACEEQATKKTSRCPFHFG